MHAVHVGKIGIHFELARLLKLYLSELMPKRLPEYAEVAHVGRKVACHPNVKVRLSAVQIDERYPWSSGAVWRVREGQRNAERVHRVVEAGSEWLSHH